MADTSNHDATTTSQVASISKPDQDAGAEQPEGGETPEETPNTPTDAIWTLTVRLPHEPGELKVTASSQEQVQDVRQNIMDQPSATQYTCFHLEHKGERMNDFVELSEIPELGPDSELVLVEDPYNEKEARMHVMRIRELVGAAGNRTDPVHGIEAGLSLHDSLTETVGMTNGHGADQQNGATVAQPVAEYDLSEYGFDGPGSINNMLLPPQPHSPKTVKSISVSPYNPPPYHLRTVGHLLYLLITTNEGEQYHVTSHVSGFFVNRSSHNKFDPLPKQTGKVGSAHSLLSLLQKLSPSFGKSFQSLLEFNSRREPLAMYQLQNAIPASPWTVKQPATQDHQSDITRTQETYLMAGQEGTDTLRDWNEEFQTTRDLPTETVQDKVFRERLTNKLFADYNEAAVRGAVLVARGEVPALNPTEGRDAQIFIYNNIFYSFGADGVGTFVTEGGDEAARVATSKDVAGVRAVNQLDIKDLYTPGTAIIDYLGKRIVAQSIVPGIFRQQEDGEHQIAYGGVEGKDVVAEGEAFVPLFQKLSSTLHVKKHPVWDKEGKRHDLEGSVETKGFNGTDARKYALDLYRLTPLDVTWIEQHWGDEKTAGARDQEKNYPHRMAVLRPELIRIYASEKLQEYLRDEIAKKRGDTKSEVNGHGPGNEKAIEGERAGGGKEITEPTEGKVAETDDKSADETTVAKNGDANGVAADDIPRVDMSAFSFSLNPDAYAGQKPQTEEEIEQMQKDEDDVRAVCNYLTSKVIPGLIQELHEGDVGFPMDGESLSTLLHKRGINIRYLGLVAEKCSLGEVRVQALKQLCVQEMVSRAFKHFAGKMLRGLPFAVAPAAIAHLLNCFLGRELNPKPAAEIDAMMRAIYTETKFEFESSTPDSVRTEILHEIRMRYRYELSGQLVEPGKEMQMLREVSLKLGLQVVARTYAFEATPKHTNGVDDAHATGCEGSGAPVTNGQVSGVTKKKKKAKDSNSPSRVSSPAPTAHVLTFHPEDVVNFVALVKEASPNSVLAEDAYEGGRISLAQDQRELAQELLLESLSLYEQIYGILHPEVARTYLMMATLYFSMDDKNAAVELARKAVIVSERTLGVDAAETITAYLNLALFEHANGNSKIGLTYLLHALELWRIIYGPNHPDCITTINNAAVMLQTMKRYEESKIWFEASLTLAEKQNGPNSIQVATILFQLGQALALVKDYRGAVNRMRECCNLFRASLGPADRNTKEAESWLEQLTQNAVNVAKNQKALQSGKLKQLRFNTSNRIPLGARPQPIVGQPSNGEPAMMAQRGMGGVDERSIDELIRYIDGEGGGKKKSSGSAAAKKRSANPKARKTAKAT